MRAEQGKRTGKSPRGQKGKGKGSGGRGDNRKWQRKGWATPAEDASETENSEATQPSEWEPEPMQPTEQTPEELAAENRELKRRAQFKPYCTKAFTHQGCDGYCGYPHVTWETHMEMKNLKKAHNQQSGVRIEPTSSASSYMEEY